jgi:hypothetical protein
MINPKQRKRLRTIEEEAGGGVSSVFGKDKNVLEYSFHENNLDSNAK